jgi:hypothetical protein
VSAHTDVGNDGWHVIPLDDLRLHNSAATCWCKPRQDDEEPSVWVHNSMDRREHTREKGQLQ